MQLHWDCIGIALELHWIALKRNAATNRDGGTDPPRRTATLEQTWNCIKIALELHWNCIETPRRTATANRPAATNRDGGTDMELHWNCIGIALELH
jgi:hypothetical protein